MIQKLDIISSIEKYHLNGIVESVKWEIKNKTLTVDFISPSQDLVGCVVYNNIDLEDGTLGIFNTSALLKMINILEAKILINVENQYKVPVRMHIEDSNYSVQYALADLYVIPNIPDISEPEYDVTFQIDRELASRFIKAKNALGSNVKEICKLNTDKDIEGNPQIKFVLGDSSSHSNKVEFAVNASYDALLKKPVNFNSAHIKEILNNNKEEFTSAIGYVSKEGLLKLEFIFTSGNAVYYLPELQLS
jgi:hypothetical protein